MLRLTGCGWQEWDDAKSVARENLRTVGQEQIDFWNSEIAGLRSLSHDAAVERLIGALKIESKIGTIQRTAGI